MIRQMYFPKKDILSIFVITMITIIKYFVNT